MRASFIIGEPATEVRIVGGTSAQALALAQTYLTNAILEKELRMKLNPIERHYVREN